jgi:hypothetical protein
MRQTFKAADSIRFLRYDDTKLVAYLHTHTHTLTHTPHVVSLMADRRSMFSGCQGNIVEVWNLEGEHINSIHVAGGHSGGMTGVLTFQVASLLSLYDVSCLTPSVCGVPPPSSHHQYDERWLFAGLHSRSSENTLVVLDFANPAPATEE